jgi:uncharacterized repeat protein (TIGR01451 family)
LNSYDPNDKQCNLPAIINPDVQENLIYTVRFQNDGNFPALNVVVRDTISSNLDLSTFRFINSKHPVSYGVNPTTREVVFRFSGINLLPSGDDLDGSQGFFTYSIDELPNLSLNTEIKNTAYIFFDFNPAIITNTTVNTNAYVGIETLKSYEVGIAPNPSNGDFTISSSEVGTFNIINELGQLVRTVEITAANNNQVKVENMPNGAYFVTGMLKGEVVTKKVMVVR